MKQAKLRRGRVKCRMPEDRRRLEPYACHRVLSLGKKRYCTVMSFLVLWHPERYEYPDRDNPGQTKKSYRERNAYYAVDPRCVKFRRVILCVDQKIEGKLKKVHFDYLQLHSLSDWNRK